MRPGQVILATAAALAAACGGLSLQDQASIGNAARLAAYSYAHVDAGTALGALQRAEVCELAAVEERNGLAVTDSGFPCPNVVESDR